MPTSAELEYVAEMGRFFSRVYRTPPAVGRVAGWLLICDPVAPTAADIAEDLQMSRSGVGEAIKTLELWKFVRRFRSVGERADRAQIALGFEAQLEASAEFAAMAEVMGRGLELLEGKSVQRRARLEELRAFNAFVAERMPQVARDWRVHRDELVRAGVLPD